jgi:hypothetical protein
MKHTILLKKVIREVIGLITIVLFIYTCTKVTSAAVRKRIANNDTISTNAASEFEWPLKPFGLHEMWLHNAIWPEAVRSKASSAENSKGKELYPITGAIRPIWAPSIRFPG